MASRNGRRRPRRHVRVSEKTPARGVNPACQMEPTIMMNPATPGFILTTSVR